MRNIFKNIAELRRKGNFERAEDLERLIGSRRKMNIFFEGDPRLETWTDSLRRSTRRLEVTSDE
jgi:hypothetical protein